MTDQPRHAHTGPHEAHLPIALLAAIESVRTLPTSRALFAHAKVMHVMDGEADVDTSQGTHHLTAGMSFAIGGGQWCQVHPRPHVRMWTIYVDETHTMRLITDEGVGVPGASVRG